MNKKYINPNIKLPESLPLTIDQYVEGIKSRDMSIISKAITLVESELNIHRVKALNLLNILGPPPIVSKKIAITGSPGVGKSSFIETLCYQWPEHSVAVLAVDPSSQSTKGSILGDKTRMSELSTRKNAFIRPSPAGQTLGGIAAKTKEAIVICEHAGFDNIIVETVGVGQSETTVSKMVDMVILLILPGSGDEIQGIKKGIVELADMVVITKADEDRQSIVLSSKKSYRNALHLLQPKYPNWRVPVSTASILKPATYEEVVNQIENFFQYLTDTKLINQIREQQELDWFNRSIQESFSNRLLSIESLKTLYESLNWKISSNNISAISAIRTFNDSLDQYFS